MRGGKLGAEEGWRIGRELGRGGLRGELGTRKAGHESAMMQRGPDWGRPFCCGVYTRYGNGGEGQREEVGSEATIYAGGRTGI